MQNAIDINNEGSSTESFQFIQNDITGNYQFLFVQNIKAQVTFSDNIFHDFTLLSSNYMLQIDFPNNGEFILNNVTFSDNKCNSLYGGGTGLKFSNSGKITFNNCKFII